MKALMFLNPKRKRKKNPYTKSSKRTVREFVGTTPKTMAKKKKKYTAKKSAAVKRRKTRSTRRTRRSSARRSSARRSSSRRLRVASTGSGVLVTNPYRRHRRHRRSMRRNPSTGGGLMSTVKRAFSKENISIAGGAIAATALTRFLVDKTIKTKDNPNPLNLPLLNDQTADDKRGMGIIVYTVATPLAAAFLLRRRMPNIAKGLVLGSVINGISEVIRQNSTDNYNKYLASPQEAYAASLVKVEATKAYLNRSNIPNMLPVGLIPATRTPGYSGSNLFSRVRTTNGALDNSRAFPTDAW
jgi:hypothetical protein